MLQHYLRAIMGLACLVSASAAPAQQTLTPTQLSIVDNLLLDDATPGPARASGYNTETFHGTKLGTTTGTWQPFNFFSWTQRGGSATQSGGSMILTDSFSSNAGVSTAIQCTTWCGIAFGGGFYAQAKFSFTGTPTGHDAGWPAFWMMAIEHLAPLTGQQWPGQQHGYLNFNEFDVMEADVSATKYGATSHNHYGTSNAKDAVSSHTADYPGGTVNSPHTYGFLWVPATSTSQGYANYYFDGALVGRDTWNLFNSANNPPCVAPGNPIGCTVGGTAFSFGDSQHYALILGSSGTAFTMTVTDVQVWQASAAGNLVQ